MIAQINEGNLEVPKAISETEVMALLHAPRPATKSELLPTLSGYSRL